jgi:NAD(P)-dependent dehydrogenase (short-subunit alcohol dehydrogenase family)
MEFKDKVVLITGGSRGIGKATSIEFDICGANVIINYSQNKAKAEELLKSLKGQNHSIYQADLRQPSQIKEMVDFVIYKYERIDILVNNAGIFQRHDIDNINFEDWANVWKDTIDTNLIGVANLCYYSAEHMIAQNSGRIINVSSRGAFRGEPNSPAYGASKAGLNSLSQSLAKYLGKYNIGVSVVAPGFVKTEMSEEILKTDEGIFIKNESPFGRVAKPEEIAHAITYLASDKAEFSTGAIIDINGASYLRS